MTWSESAGRLGKEPAQRPLARFADSHLFITPTIAGEFASGFGLAERTVWARFLAPFGVLQIDNDVAWHFGTIYRHLQQNGMLIGANDVWTAAAAQAYGCPVVSRDTDHYRRVPDLDIVGY